MIDEPEGRASIPPRIAVGLLAALRRHALAALALHAGVDRGVTDPLPALAPLAEQISSSLQTVAASVRSGAPPAPLPPLRQTQLALGLSSSALVGVETDLMVDSINTMADLLRRQKTL
jgi:hypothetical protein